MCQGPTNACMSTSIINVQVVVYVPPREKCVRHTLRPFRVRTHQVLLRTHVCVCAFENPHLVGHLAVFNLALGRTRTYTVINRTCYSE